MMNTLKKDLKVEKKIPCKYCDAEPVWKTYKLGDIERGYWDYPCECEYEIREQEEKETKEKEKKDQYLKNGIPIRFKDISFDNTIPSEDNQEIYNKSLEWIQLFTTKQTNKGLFFFGPFGIGKTHLACCIAHEIYFKNNNRFYFYSTPIFLERIRNSFNGERPNPLEDLLEYPPPLLILDDIGKEKPSNWVKEQLYILINYYYENLLSIIFTSNCNEKDLNKNLGEAIISRIYEMCYIYNFEGKDKRKE